MQIKTMEVKWNPAFKYWLTKKLCKVSGILTLISIILIAKLSNAQLTWSSSVVMSWFTSSSCSLSSSEQDNKFIHRHYTYWSCHNIITTGVTALFSVMCKFSNYLSTCHLSVIRPKTNMISLWSNSNFRYEDEYETKLRNISRQQV